MTYEGHMVRKTGKLRLAVSCRTIAFLRHSRQVRLGVALQQRRMPPRTKNGGPRDRVVSADDVVDLVATSLLLQLI